MLIFLCEDSIPICTSRCPLRASFHQFSDYQLIFPSSFPMGQITIGSKISLSVCFFLVRGLIDEEPWNHGELCTGFFSLCWWSRTYRANPLGLGGVFGPFPWVLKGRFAPKLPLSLGGVFWGFDGGVCFLHLAFGGVFRTFPWGGNF